jgi:hypothetical protein
MCGVKISGLTSTYLYAEITNENLKNLICRIFPRGYLLFRGHTRYTYRVHTAYPGNQISQEYNNI